MSTPSSALPRSSEHSQFTAPAAISPTRPFYWSVRRELWENRSIYIAPLAVAGVVLFGSLLRMITLPQRMRALEVLDQAQQRAAITKPYSFVAMLIIATSCLVGVFYSLDALHGERRDRSILFWKSLPVSDFITVLSKASIPIVILPLLSFAVIVVTQLIMLLLSSLVLLMSGLTPATLWTEWPIFPMSVCLFYAFTVLALWHAPMYAWLLVVSSWAKRSTFLWAVLPLLAVCAVEKIVFHTWHFTSWLGYRLGGGIVRAFNFHVGGSPGDPWAQLTIGRFLTTPGLWFGLIVAAGFLFAAVRLRRYREPI
jgi:ABC-2 type transport system permease protein